MSVEYHMLHRRPNEMELSDAAIGRMAIDRLLANPYWSVPKISEIVALRPQAGDFRYPDVAIMKGADHGQEHIADGLILGIPFWQYYATEHAMLNIPVRAMGRAWMLHDLDVDGPESVLNHGAHLVQRWENAQKHLQYGDDWDIMRFIIAHHSDRIGDAKAHAAVSGYSIRFRHALMAFQDVDASFLMRDNVQIPIHEITLRTSLAWRTRLPYVASALLEEAKTIHTGDSFMDHIVAGARLKLVQQDDNYTRE